MTRKLILIRHAKSAWDDPFADDHARVLNDRGRASAAAIGAWLARRGHVPDQILSSDSARTVETVERLLAAMSGVPAPEVHFRRTLYHAGPGTLMTELRGATGQAVALVAHNPGIGDFAGLMVDRAPDHDRFGDYPTAATTVMAFDIDAWAAAEPRRGRVLDFVVPRDLL